MFGRKTLVVFALVCSVAFSASAATSTDDSRRELLPRFISFIISHLPPWLHAVPADEWPVPPKP